MDATTGLLSTLDIRHENGIWVDLRIANNGEKTVLIHNPGNYRPTEGWELSREAYNVAVLLSFHFLEMILTREDGIPVESSGIAMRADHIGEPPVALRPHAVLTISIPLHEFYDLESRVNYSLELTYGDNNLKVHAKTQFQYP
ncbi:MAG TPA: hypothetical protein VH229_08625 [Candidatus Udaeobacter sp.]|jgi:hypothetical protein|nr:hypothetical protein [Candidatus Udaeobacter sp.]